MSRVCPPPPRRGRQTRPARCAGNVARLAAPAPAPLSRLGQAYAPQRSGYLDVACRDSHVNLYPDAQSHSQLEILLNWRLSCVQHSNRFLAILGFNYRARAASCRRAATRQSRPESLECGDRFRAPQIA